MASRKTPNDASSLTMIGSQSIFIALTFVSHISDHIATIVRICGTAYEYLAFRDNLMKTKEKTRRYGSRLQGQENPANPQARRGRRDFPGPGASIRIASFFPWSSSGCPEMPNIHTPFRISERW